MPRIEIAQEFSKFPFGRFKKDGPQSAEALVEYLEPLLLERSELTLDFRGVVAAGSSYLEGVASGIAKKILDDTFRAKLLSDKQKSLSKEGQIRLVVSRIIFLCDPQTMLLNYWNMYLEEALKKF